MFPSVQVQGKQVRGKHGRVWSVAFTLLVAACGSGDDGSSVSPELVATTSVDAELTDAGITTSAVAEEEADRSELPPTKGVVTRSADAVGDGDPPQNVGTAIVRITDADGNVCEVCMWYADEPAERSTGLMGVRDLGQPIGMAFAWDAPTSGNFFMFDTPAPLSIAWFSPDGSHLAQTDMSPCLTDDSSTCERYGAGGEYQLAIEMFQGELDKVGIGPGSRVEIVAVAEPGRENLCPLLPS